MDYSSSKTRLIVGVAAGLFVSLVSSDCAPILLGSFIDTYKVSVDKSASLVTVESLSMAISMLGILGLFGQKNVLVIFRFATLVLVTTQVATSLVSSYLALVLVRMFAGVASGLAFGTVCAIVASVLDSERVFGIGLIVVNTLVIAVTTVLPPIIQLYGGRSVTMVLAVVTFVAMLFSSSLPALEKKSSISSTSAIQIDMSKPFSARTIAFVVALFATPLSLMSVLAFSERVARSMVAPGYIGLVLAIPILGLLLGSILPALFGNHWGSCRTLTLCTLVASAGASIFARADNATTLGISLLLTAACQCLLMPYCLGIASRLDRSGRLASVFGAIFMIGIAIGPIFGSLVGERYGYGTIGWVCASICALATLAFAPLARRADGKRDDRRTLGEIAS
ncbi:MFS transporter [Paraburkholderia megapolitana]|uniref:MFS transporter n=1 Tax=Paraburkholderia megapolitana TaxID=420953 RepID=UPI0038BBEC0F